MFLAPQVLIIIPPELLFHLPWRFRRRRRIVLLTLKYMCLQIEMLATLKIPLWGLMIHFCTLESATQARYLQATQVQSALITVKSALASFSYDPQCSSVQKEMYQSK